MSSLITCLPLSSFLASECSLAIFALQRYHQASSQPFVSSVNANQLSDWLKDLHFFFASSLSCEPELSRNVSLRRCLHPVGCRYLLPSEVMNHVFHDYQCGNLARGLVAVSLVVHLHSLTPPPPACRITIIDVFHCLFFMNSNVHPIL